jgi:hypothetical protein
MKSETKEGERVRGGKGIPDEQMSGRASQRRESTEDGWKKEHDLTPTSLRLSLYIYTDTVYSTRTRMYIHTAYGIWTYVRVCTFTQHMAYGHMYAYVHSHRIWHMDICTRMYIHTAYGIWTYVRSCMYAHTGTSVCMCACKYVRYASMYACVRVHEPNRMLETECALLYQLKSHHIQVQVSKVFSTQVQVRKPSFSTVCPSPLRYWSQFLLSGQRFYPKASNTTTR